MEGRVRRVVRWDIFFGGGGGGGVGSGVGIGGGGWGSGGGGGLVTGFEVGFCFPLAQWAFEDTRK